MQYHDPQTEGIKHWKLCNKTEDEENNIKEKVQSEETKHWKLGREKKQNAGTKYWKLCNNRKKINKQKTMQENIPFQKSSKMAIFSNVFTRTSFFFKLSSDQ